MESPDGDYCSSNIAFIRDVDGILQIVVAYWESKHDIPMVPDTDGSGYRFVFSPGCMHRDLGGWHITTRPIGSSDDRDNGVRVLSR